MLGCRTKSYDRTTQLEKYGSVTMARGLLVWSRHGFQEVNISHVKRSAQPFEKLTMGTAHGRLGWRTAIDIKT